MRTISKTLPGQSHSAPQFLTPIDQNIWEVNAPVKIPGLRMTHRMTVLRLQSGGPFIVKDIRLERHSTFSPAAGLIP